MSETKPEAQPIPQDLSLDEPFALEVQHDGQPMLITTSLRALGAALAPVLSLPGGGGAAEPQNPPLPPPQPPLDAIPVLMTLDDVATLIVPQVVEELRRGLKLRLVRKDGAKVLATTTYVLRDLAVEVDHG